MFPWRRTPQNRTCAGSQQTPGPLFSRPGGEALADTGQGLLKRDSDKAWVGAALKWTLHCREIASWPIILAPPLSTRALWAWTSNSTLHTMNWRLGPGLNRLATAIPPSDAAHTAKLTTGRFVRQPTSARQTTIKAPSQSIVCPIICLSPVKIPRVEGIFRSLSSSLSLRAKPGSRALSVDWHFYDKFLCFSPIFVLLFPYAFTYIFQSSTTFSHPRLSVDRPQQGR